MLSPLRSLSLGREGACAQRCRPTCWLFCVELRADNTNGVGMCYSGSGVSCVGLKPTRCASPPGYENSWSRRLLKRWQKTKHRAGTLFDDLGGSLAHFLAAPGVLACCINSGRSVGGLVHLQRCTLSRQARSCGWWSKFLTS